MLASSRSALASARQCRQMSHASNKLSGQVAVLTGSTDGIGLAIAKRMGQEGARVVVSSRRSHNVERAVQEMHDLGLKDVLGVQCNVGKPEDRHNLIDQAVCKWGGVDILVTNAAVNPATGWLLDCSESVWDKLFDINVKSTWALTKLVAPHMQKKKKGSIIYVSSVAGFGGIVPNAAMSGYIVSKTCLLSMSKMVAQQLASDNVRVNCLLPGLFKTRFGEVLHADNEISKFMLPTIPMRRFGEPDEIAGMAAFLASDDASYITGENFAVAGGMQTRL
ncbi:dehydrogenase/reductase SDR family member 4-like [Hyalella azteca]|uniref:Dehydrogenase/reductase SDR family member 4-like n=1 Tax=Hyalella azteca TaxID=294128 RepID=A0A8B7NBC9_HYAAZ|nr:dehydrogenase/reductase SDR family member 4-like [Hyalella azteca]XP_018010890.1 dehydrogenase/reductase SDR family member 4-like [Hyalella azteca]